MRTPSGMPTGGMSGRNMPRNVRTRLSDPACEKPKNLRERSRSGLVSCGLRGWWWWGGGVKTLCSFLWSSGRFSAPRYSHPNLPFLAPQCCFVYSVHDPRTLLIMLICGNSSTGLFRAGVPERRMTRRQILDESDTACVFSTFSLLHRALVARRMGNTAQS
jgi:hypothetical protein